MLQSEISISGRYFCKWKPLLYSIVPVNVVLSAPVDYTIQIDYDFPSTYYPEGSAPNPPTDKIYVEATCNLEDGTGPTLKGNVSLLVF